MSENKATLKKGWNFDNSYVRLPQSFYTRQDPIPVRSPEMAVLNDAFAVSLGLDPEYLKSREGLAVLAGNEVPDGAEPLAQAYAGHQFGHFTMLGDGRAVLLGEQITPEGKRVDIQLKGPGRTPYSRRGDGRAALGPMLREYIISEAMHGLGIPTTRSLAVVTTGEPVFREQELPGAILTRIAASHIRVGTFQYAANMGTSQDLRAIADYTLQRHYPEIEADDDRYLNLLRAVIKRQAGLIAQWQLVGFIHGVMNTDNMSISGETIDYGPCAFMNSFDPATVFSSIDSQGRYAYGNQPPIAAWNLSRFAESLLPLLHHDEDHAVKLAEEAISDFPGLYHGYWLDGMRSKLGIRDEEEEDETLIKDLLGMMREHRSDYTNTFRALTFDRVEDTGLSEAEQFGKWYERWKARVEAQPGSWDASHELMRSANPAVIPRNHRVEEAIEAAAKNGDYSVMERLLEALRHPYAHQESQIEYCSPPEPSERPYRTYCGT
ncbi:protein adenylyltransferase SelO [Paenibacillus tarimensis]|uniref:protein adenylyltransferase SelO n=1 Tax=Paenibacillus tarimensis TaxID=416012 RepID=UPI001F320679|nr:YdiU family protein [Paenibacillus tarimensis]MCF2945539.1 YdiU family protein [Paenibacillus tarimensis]